MRSRSCANGERATDPLGPPTCRLSRLSATLSSDPESATTPTPFPIAAVSLASRGQGVDSPAQIWLPTTSMAPSRRYVDPSGERHRPSLPLWSKGLLDWEPARPGDVVLLAGAWRPSWTRAEVSEPACAVYSEAGPGVRRSPHIWLPAEWSQRLLATPSPIAVDERRGEGIGARGRRATCVPKTAAVVPGAGAGSRAAR